jgi:hypothetical protein
MSTTSRLRRTLYWTGGILATATVLTVAIHLGPVRKALGWKPLGVADATGGTHSGWCPFGFGHVDGDGKIVATTIPRPAAHALDPSKAIAAGRPALGFTLDVSTRADVLAWAKQYEIACTDIQGGTLQCKDVPARALPADESALGLQIAWFSFPFDDKLEIVKSTRYAADADAVVAALDAEQAALTAKAGAPSVRDGDLDASHLALGALRQAHAEFQFQNYRATLRATNMGAQGYAMSEMYAAVL